MLRRHQQLAQLEQPLATFTATAPAGDKLRSLSPRAVRRFELAADHRDHHHGSVARCGRTEELESELVLAAGANSGTSWIPADRIRSTVR